MPSAPPKETVTKPTDDRNTPEERVTETLVFPYSRSFRRDADASSRVKDEVMTDTFVCRVRKSTVKKLGLEEYVDIATSEDKEGNIRILKGARGAKSWRFIYSVGNGRLTSYSFPVPAWASIIDFLIAVVSKIDKKNRPLKIVSPNGVSYGAGFIDKALKIKAKPKGAETKVEDGLSVTP